MRSTTLSIAMCRSIKPLFNYDPPVNEEDIRAASLQFVRKISGYHHPSHTNERVFESAVDEIAAIAYQLLSRLETKAPPRNREKEIEQKRAARTRALT